MPRADSVGVHCFGRRLLGTDGAAVLGGVVGGRARLITTNVVFVAHPVMIAIAGTAVGAALSRPDAVYVWTGVHGRADAITVFVDADVWRVLDRKHGAHGWRAVAT